ETDKGLTSESSVKKKGRTVAITTEDMQKRRNDVKARTTLLLALPDEHQLKMQYAASLSHDTVNVYIATQSNGSQIKYKDITQIDEDDIEEMDIKYNMALLSMRADRKNTENLNTKISKLNEELSDCEIDLYNYKRGLPEFVDDTVTNYSRSTPNIDASKCNKSKLQSSNFFAFEHGESSDSIMSKPMIKFVKEADCLRVIKTNNTENARKSTVKYAEMYRNISKGNKGKAIKASACWIWRPKQNTSEQGLNYNGVLVTFKKYQYIDTQGRLKSDSGCSQHMTGNISYLSEYEPYDGGYVSFGHGDDNVADLLTKPFDVGRFQNLYDWGIHRILMGEGSANPTEPHHTPSPQEHHSPQHDSPPPSNQTIISEPIPQAPTETLTPRRYTRRAIRIAQSKALSPTADEPAYLSRDDRQGKAFPTISSLDVVQDRENIAKTSAMPHESSSRVPSLAKIKDQDLEIFGLKARVKSLEDKERRHAEPTQEDASITGGIINIREELGEKKSIELGSNDTEKMVNVLSLMEAVNILSSGGAAASVSPTDVLPAAGVPTVSGSFPTVSAIFTTTSVEQIDAQVARKMEDEFARKNQRSNEVIIKHLSEYEQAKADLSVREKIKLIRELVKYQDHRTKILKYQAQQSKPLSKKEQREFYMYVLRSHAGWKTKHFRGMTLLQIKEKFTPVWKQFEDFVHMSSKEESERVKRQGLKIDQGNFKDQLWTHHQAFMHDPLDWKLYDTCGVHHVSTKDQEIFMLVEKDYPLRKGLATAMISNKLQVEQYSQMASDLILKIHNIANSPR
nr:hypothetical protein [Tanacetum cinerariifolium]